MPESEQKLDVEESQTKIDEAEVDGVESNDSENDLGRLSQSWLEKIGDIRTTAQENQRAELENSRLPTIADNAIDVPDDSELFAEAVSENHLNEQIFSGDKDFFKTIAVPTNNGAGAEKFAKPTQPAMTTTMPATSWGWGQKIMACGIVVIAMALVYVVTKISSYPYNAPVQATIPTQIQPSQPESVAWEDVPASEIDQGLSLKTAQDLYLSADYANAYSVYKQLAKYLPENSSQNLTRDFLNLQMASCLMKNANYELTENLLKKAVKSPSPVIKIVSNYQLGLLDIQKKQYLNARTRAYKAMALINTAGLDSQWKGQMRRNCDIMAAGAITRQTLRLCDGDKNLPVNLWNSDNGKDVFLDIDEAQLNTTLAYGIDTLNESVLSPKILAHPGSNGGLWNVACHKASIGDVLSRFSANNSLDLHWPTGQEQAQVRQKAISVYLSGAMTQQVIETAAGCVGLLATFDKKNVVEIHNPAQYSQTSENLELLSKESILLWQRFIFNTQKDSYLANAHYLLGLLKTAEQPSEAIAEYKLLANHFERAEIAPYALLNSSQIKNSMSNYAGAKRDLTQLIEQHNDSEVVYQGYLSLADNQVEAGFYDEAAKMYLKVYHLGLSGESKAKAALAAGESFYKIKNYEQAETWLSEYTNLTKGSKPENLYYAYFLLGKVRLDMDKPETACISFLAALSGDLSKDDHAETVLALAKSYKKQQDYISAIDVLEKAQFTQFSQQKSTEMLILKSAALREIGLADKAIAILGDRAEYTANTIIKTQILFEISKCYIEKGQLDIAHKELTGLLANAPAGNLANEIALSLSLVCLELEQYSQAASVCLKLLETSPEKIVEQRAVKLLAEAYQKQNDYESATLALLGQWK
ncbi:MAG: tetratricopeptide repeat protein [Anaerohalosphaeraceae bacterium]|nr:tetratricopeptide repeat protein [Anaerohalosphaeraceae bacterium]